MRENDPHRAERGDRGPNFCSSTACGVKQNPQSLASSYLSVTTDGTMELFVIVYACFWRKKRRLSRFRNMQIGQRS